MIILLVGLGVLLVVLCIYFHIRIDIKSFFRKGFKAKRGPYGTYAFCGEQGKGKTTSITKWCLDNNEKIYVFSNIEMIGINNYEFFQGFDSIYSILERLDKHQIKLDGKQIVFCYDEIFTEMTKNSKLNTDIMEFLCQLRKRKIIFLTTCQSWAELPLSFRRLCRYEIDCSILPLIRNTILINVYKDAERMKWNEIEMDFVAPIVWTKISKMNKVVMNSFDSSQLIYNKKKSSKTGGIDPVIDEKKTSLNLQPVCLSIEHGINA